MLINNTNTRNFTPNFKAKFLHSESLKLVADYAVAHGKFNKLNSARKNIVSYSYSIIFKSARNKGN